MWVVYVVLHFDLNQKYEKACIHRAVCSVKENKCDVPLIDVCNCTECEKGSALNLLQFI